MKTRILVLAAALMVPPLAADAQSYRCTSKDGRKYYGSAVPPQCIGQPVEVMNRQGRVVRRIDPEGTEKERVAKEAAEAKKREQLALQREAARRNRALLATYTSTKDIDQARKRALESNHKAIQDLESRIEQLRKREAGYEKELELYKETGTPPSRLADDVRNTRMDLQYQQELLAAKRKEQEQINERYDEDKKRYGQLTGKR
jgi:hypothetical protein